MAVRAIAQLFDLTGKSAVVTGGAMGIGKAIAFRLAEAGASVMIADIDLDAAQQAAEEIKVWDRGVGLMYADARSANDAKKVARATTEMFGRLDILVNNAGVYPYSPVLETSEELWDEVIDVNLKGAFLYSQACAQEMVRVGSGGKIINIASMDALHAHAELAHYSAAKGGLVMFTKTLALELAHYGILVNGVAPGNIMTPGSRATASVLQSRGGDTEKLGEAIMARLPLGRMGRPDDVAKVVLFLASGAADYVAGSTILVDGGFLLS